jgi:hypothetical protein
MTKRLVTCSSSLCIYTNYNIHVCICEYHYCKYSKNARLQIVKEHIVHSADIFRDKLRIYRTVLQNIMKCFSLDTLYSGITIERKESGKSVFAGAYADWCLSFRRAVRSVLVKNLIDNPWRSGFAPPTRSEASDYAVRSLLLTDFIIPRHFISDWQAR